MFSIFLLFLFGNVLDGWGVILSLQHLQEACRHYDACRVLTATYFHISGFTQCKQSLIEYNIHIRQPYDGIQAIMTSIVLLLCDSCASRYYTHEI